MNTLIELILTLITWIYESLNDPSKYLSHLKRVMRKLNNNMDVPAMYPTVVSQEGITDCGLFALGYALAICKDINPSLIVFEQERMREEFNYSIRNNTPIMFSHTLKLEDQVQIMQTMQYNLADF